MAELVFVVSDAILLLIGVIYQVFPLPAKKDRRNKERKFAREVSNTVVSQSD